MSLTAGDLIKAVGYAVVTAFATLSIGSGIGGDPLPAMVGRWLLMLVCGAAGAALRGRRRD